MIILLNKINYDPTEEDGSYITQIALNPEKIIVAYHMGDFTRVEVDGLEDYLDITEPVEYLARYANGEEINKLPFT